MINKFEQQIYDWLYTCPSFNALYMLYANLTNQDLDEQVVLVPELIGGDTDGKRYLRRSGHNFRWYDFTIVQYLTLKGEENQSTNAEILQKTIEIQQWIMKQFEIGNYPNIGHRIVDSKVNGITESGIDENGGIKLQFQASIKYES